MNAARWVAAAVVAITIGMNAGTLWVVFATDFLDRFMGAGITAIQVAILDGTVVAFMAGDPELRRGWFSAGRPIGRGPYRRGAAWRGRLLCGGAVRV